MNKSILSPFTALSLKLVGIILVVSSLLDYISLLIPFNFQNPQWQVTFAVQMVDRGIIPMVGICFLLIAYWIDSSFEGVGATSKGLDIRLPVYLFASLLGLIFLLIVPLYLNNLRLVSTDIIAQIQQGASQAETRIQEQYDQLNALSQDSQRLKQLDTRVQQIEQALSSGKLNGQTISDQDKTQLRQTQEQLKNFSELAKNPQALEAELNRLQTELRTQKLDRENLAKTQVLKQGLRTGLSSLMLAVGYTIIGWGGIKGLGSTKKG